MALVSLAVLVSSCVPDETTSDANGPNVDSFTDQTLNDDKPGEAGFAVDTNARSDLAEIVRRAQRTFVLSERAENVLIAECMAEAGFDYHAPTSTDLGLRSEGVLLGDLNPAEAAENGYGIYIPGAAGGETEDKERQKSLEYINSLSEDELDRFVETLQGGGDETAATIDAGGPGITIGLDGCTGEARRELLGDDILEIYEVFFTLQLLPYAEVSGYQNVREAEGQWSDCMSDAGYNFDMPWNAVDEGLILRADRLEPLEAEIDLAVTDARCREVSGIADATLSALATQNKVVLEEHEATIASWAVLEIPILEQVGGVLGVELAAAETRGG